MFNRTIFVSDTHGFQQPWMTLFKDYGICDSRGNWLPSDTRLIHVGDHVDRGNNSVEMYRLVKMWQEQTDSGTVVRLIGNHDFQYVGGPECEKEPSVTAVAEELRSDVLSGNFKFAHVFEITDEIKYLVVHAGLSGHWDILHSRDINDVCDLINAAGIDVVSTGRYNGIVSGIGSSRGGHGWELPGVTWADFYDDLVPTEDKIHHHQIVGHSIQPAIRTSPQGKIWAINVMYAHAQALIFDHRTNLFSRSSLYIPRSSQVEADILRFASIGADFEIVRTEFASY